MDGWENFFIAETGASAALLGLLFVSVSINLSRILSFSPLPSRAFGALMILLVVLIISSLQLVPAQPNWLIGAEILIVGICAWVVIIRIDSGIIRSAKPDHLPRSLSLIALNQTSLILYIAAGVATLVVGKVGLYLLVPAIVASFIKATLDAWVLLVEINR
jgi:modulator of FtsH protease